MANPFQQQAYEIRCEWGAAGITALLPTSDAIVIVDVLSFSTAVDVAVANGALIYPYQFRDDRAATFAATHGAILASRQRWEQGSYSLAPSSLRTIPPGTRLVLPSPNGATLSLMTDDLPTIAGCLRNASAVARAVQHLGPRISVIPAGERWPDGTLRPALEDLIGAGAIIHALPGPRSPEAELAEATFLHFRAKLGPTLMACGSGQELILRDFTEDVTLAAALDSSITVPRLHAHAYQPWEGTTSWNPP